MPRGGKNHARGGGGSRSRGGKNFSRAVRARRTVYFLPPLAILVVRLVQQIYRSFELRLGFPSAHKIGVQTMT